MKKTLYVENRKSWKKEYGTFLDRKDKISFDIKKINEIFPLEKNKAIVLDAGCSYGYHLRLLKNVNPLLNLFGLEISSDASEDSKNLKVAKIFNQSIAEKMPFKNNSVDLIYSMDVVEHLKDEKEFSSFLNEASRILKPRAKLIIKTPAMTFSSLIAAFFSFNLKKYFAKDHTLPLNYKKIKKLTPSFLEIEKVFYTANKNQKLLNLICNMLTMHHIWVVLKKK